MQFEISSFLKKMPAKAAGFGSMFFKRNVMLNDKNAFKINNWLLFGKVADSCYSIKLNNLWGNIF